MIEAVLGWTDDRVALLSKLWLEGLSASQIAAALGGGVTRNAVIGKVHRLGLSGRGKTGQAPPPRPARPRAASPSSPSGEVPEPDIAAAPGAAPVSVPAPRPQAAVALQVSERVSIHELRDSMCRWPIGDPSTADFGFCGARATPGLPYCGHHCAIAYQPAAERRRLRA